MVTDALTPSTGSKSPLEGTLASTFGPELEGGSGPFVVHLVSCIVMVICAS